MERCCLETAAAHYITRALERTNYKLVDRRFLRSMIEQAAEMLKRCELSRVFFFVRCYVIRIDHPLDPYSTNVSSLFN